MAVKCDQCLDEGDIDDGKGRRVICTACDAYQKRKQEFLDRLQRVGFGWILPEQKKEVK